MTLNHGIDFVSIPGPSILPDRVRAELARPMPNIYDGPLLDTSARLLERLPSIARTSGRVFAVIGNGHAAWQMSLSNTLVSGDKVLVLESGRFAIFWGEYARAAGMEVETLAGDMRSPVDPEKVEARLRSDNASIKAVLVAHTDTSSSVRNDLAAIRTAMDTADHDALLMVDGIASIGAERFEMDEWGVDLAIGASQKGLMCPPGLAFVWASEKAMATYRSLPADRTRVSYFDWKDRIAPEVIYQSYAGTPPVLHIRALDAALDLIDEEGGLDAVWRRHQVLADAVRAAVDAWSAPGGLELNITSPEHRSNAVTTIRTGSVNSATLTQLLEREYGVTVGIGMSEASDRSFRIGHMGHVNPPMILGPIGAIEAALLALDAPMGGSGAAAAAAVIGASSL